MSKGKEELIIEQIEFAEGLGNYRLVETIMRLRGDELRMSKNADVRAKFEEITKRTSAAFDYEGEYGAGSLLNLKRPLNHHFIKNSRISKEEVEAALRHQKRTSALDS